ncbi:hypothetical protein [Streptomyces sp. NPDC001970]
MAGTILVAELSTGADAAAMITLAVIGFIGLAAAGLLPKTPTAGDAAGAQPWKHTRAQPGQRNDRPGLLQSEP